MHGFLIPIATTMEKDKKKENDMSNKKRLQNLVWDGLFNGLENGTTESKEAAPKKKDKKAGKNDSSNGDSERPSDS
jgi:hypothetical protein